MRVHLAQFVGSDAETSPHVERDPVVRVRFGVRIQTPGRLGGDHGVSVGGGIVSGLCEVAFQERRHFLDPLGVRAFEHLGHAPVQGLASLQKLRAPGGSDRVAGA